MRLYFHWIIPVDYDIRMFSHPLVKISSESLCDQLNLLQCYVTVFPWRWLSADRLLLVFLGQQLAEVPHDGQLVMKH